MAVGAQRYMVDVKFYDDESSPDTSAKLTEKLITEDKVNFILGPYGTSQTLSASAITEKYKKPMVEANGAAEAIFNRGFRYVFSPMTPAKFYLRGIVDACLDKDPTIKTIALLADNDTFSVEVADGTQSYAKDKGLNVVYYEKVPADTKDVSAQLTQIKPKNPDLFISSGHYASAALVMKQSKELKFNPKAFGFSVGPALPQFTDSLKADAEYVFGGTQWTPSLKYKDEQFGTAADYATKFKAFAGYDPAYQNAESTCAGPVLPAGNREGGQPRHREGAGRAGDAPVQVLLRGREVRQPRHQRATSRWPPSRSRMARRSPSGRRQRRAATSNTRRPPWDKR